VIAKERLKLAFTSMEGSAYHWFKFLRQKQEPTSEEFSVALIRRFGGRDFHKYGRECLSLV